MTRSKSHTNETTSQDEKKDNKHKRKRQKHFHRVGRIEGSSRKHTRKPLSNKDTDDSDSSYQLSNYENTTDNKESSTNNTQNNNNDSSSNTVSANSTDNQSTALPEFDLYIEKEDDGDASKNWLDTTDTKEEGKTTTIAEQIELRRQSQSKYQYSKNIAEKEPNFIIKKKSKKTKDKHPKNATKTIPKQLTRAEKLEQFLSNMDIPKYWIRVIPSFLIRENKVNIEESSTKKSFKRMVSLCSKIIETGVKTICPGPGYPKFRKFLLQKMNQGFDTYNSSLPYHRTDKEKVDTVSKVLCEWSNKSGRRTIERRVIRAILNESFLKNEIKSFREQHGLKQGTGRVIQQARADAIELSHGRRIKLSEIRRQQRKDTTIAKCVKFILSDDNVVSVAWGTKKVLLQSRGETLLPKLTRKVTVKSMYLRYKELVSDDDENIKSETL